MRLLIFSLPLFFLLGCGYHLENPRHDSDRVSISVPYVIGDSAGQLTNELVRQLSASGTFACVQNHGKYVLKVTVFSDGSEKIGFRYDRKDNSFHGGLKHNLMPVEGRRLISAEVTLLKASTQEILVGPVVVKADADYDYIDSDCLQELAFINEKGHIETTLKFSLGQLDSIEGAQDDVSVPLYRHLAQKIVDGLENSEFMSH